jgi:hypothetical protein
LSENFNTFGKKANFNLGYKMAFNVGGKFNQFSAPWGQMDKPGIMGNYTVVDKVPQEMLHLVDDYWYQFQVNLSFSIHLIF